MDITLLQDTFKYFAKFPLMSGVNKNFNVTSSNRFGTDYTDFQNEISTLEETELIPDIEDYIFGVDEDMVKRRVQDVTGIYLFIDYGAINKNLETTANVEMDSLVMAVTVAFPVNENELDAVETMLMHQQTLNYISQIKNKMKEDSKKTRLVDKITFPVEITPWFARELMNSSGWTMQLSYKGPGLV